MTHTKNKISGCFVVSDAMKKMSSCFWNSFNFTFFAEIVFGVRCTLILVTHMQLSDLWVVDCLTQGFCMYNKNYYFNSLESHSFWDIFCHHAVVRFQHTGMPEKGNIIPI